MKNLPLKLILILSLITGLCSCEKKKEDIVFDSKLAESEADMIMAFDDAEYITFEGMELSNNIMEGRALHDEGPLAALCAKASFSVQNNTTTIDFGEGCPGPDGKFRKGKINISQTGKYFEPGTIVTTVLDQYSVNDVLVDGTIILTNTSPERTQSTTFNIQINEGKAFWDDQTSATREIAYTRIWKRSDDPNKMEYEVSGTATGIGRNGKAYTSEIKNFLSYQWACLSSHTYLPVTGKLSLTFDNDEIFEIHYGTGACDNRIHVFHDGIMKDIDLF
ncbi:MAG: hypothetical protein M3512_15480 [Bacteroidota bacterium]|nr:hypothetical protein [Bacteroidota bacterium]